MENQTGNAVTDTRDLSVSESSNDQFGKIKINNNVIAVIAHETAQKVQGVVELHGSLTDGLAEIIGKKPKDRCIRIEKEGDEFLTIDLSVVIEFGVNEIIASPSISIFFRSDCANKKSPCNTPFIPRRDNSLNAIDSFVANSPE